MVRDPGIYGCRWSVNGLLDVFITELDIIEGYQWNKYLPCDYVSHDCIVRRIYRLRDGMEFPRLTGRAFYPYCYETGKRITGASIYYCRSMDELIEYQGKMIRTYLKLHEQLMQLIDRYNRAENKQSKKTILSNINFLRHY